MKKAVLVLVAAAVVLGSALVSAPAAQALPSATGTECYEYSMGPIRGNGEHPPVLGVRNAPIGLTEFDETLGQLTSAKITATVTATVQGTVTNETASAQQFRPVVGGQAFAGREGANGYVGLGRMAAEPVVNLAANQTTAVPLTTVTNTVSKTYDAALWDTLGNFNAYVVIDDQFTNTDVFEWSFTRDDVYFLVCVQYFYQPRVERVAGADRFETSADVALAAYPSGADTVYIATGTNYPDALAAGPAAAADGAPLLLVTPTAIPAAISTAIAELDPTHIVVVGGTSSVSTAVYNQLKGMTTTIERVSGADRFATSRLLAERGFDQSDWVFIATGLNFPDALSAGPAASAYDAPVILINGGAGGLDTATEALIESLDPQVAVIVGGPATVSNGIQSDLDAILPDAIRFAGSDRFDTSHLVNEYAFSSSGNATAYFATGMSFPDALSGSAWAAANGAPLFVVQQSCVPGATVIDLEDMRIAKVVLLGGTASLGAPVASFTEC